MNIENIYLGLYSHKGVKHHIDDVIVRHINNNIIINTYVGVRFFQIELVINNHKYFRYFDKTYYSNNIRNILETYIAKKKRTYKLSKLI